ncbi:MAG: hydrolase [Nanoarchaeota archaeon]|nr:hydrolase [Nanoarchaeota archaeon]
MSSNINPKDSLLLIVDIQEKFRPVISGIDDIISNIAKLVRAFNLLKIPILVTEQYPKGLGSTVKEISHALDKFDYVEKVCFDCFEKKEFADLIKKKNVKNIIISGIESHVCIIQTALSALEKGFDVYAVADAISSRKKIDYEIALRRMEKEGVKLVSTEMIIFQMIEDAKDENFKEISRIVK